MADLTKRDVDITINDPVISTRKAKVTLRGSLLTEDFGSLLIDEVFSDGTIDTTERWTETIVGGGSTGFANKNLQLSVTTASGDQIQEVFKQEVSPLSGADAEYLSGIKFGTEQASNIKEWGLLSLDEADGLFFRLDGTTLRFVEKNAGSETTTDIDSFKPTDSDFHSYTIRFGVASTYEAIIDNDVVLSTNSSDIPITSTKTFVPFWNHENTALLGGAASDLEIIGVIIIDKSGSRIVNNGKDDNGFVRDVAVNSTGRLLVSQEAIAAEGRINQFTRQDVASHETTLTSYTVPSGKIVDITSWHFATETAVMLCELQIDGTAVDAIRFNNSANTNRLNAIYGTSAIQASGTQVIRLQTIEGDTAKEVIAGFIGNQRDE